MVGVAGTRTYEFARRLAERGFDVHVVTSATHADQSEPRKWKETDEAGVRVHWFPIPYSNKMPFKQRIAAFLDFAWQSGGRAASLRGDVLYATSGPLTIAIPALYAKLRSRANLVFEVRDLWPEGAVQLGVLTNPVAIAASRVLERLAYKSSSHIVALSPGMKDGIVNAGISPEKVSVIPNACDLELFHPEVSPGDVRRQFGLEEKFVCSYFGTMGLANGLGFVLDAAEILKRRGIDDIAFLLHGDGMERSQLEESAASRALSNVVFSDPVPDKTWIARLAASSDVCMTIYKDVPVLYTCSPNKLFDGLSAGRPCIANMPGAVARLLEENECGVSVDPGNPEDLANCVVRLRDLPSEQRQRMGQNARTLGERVFSRDRLAGNLARILESVASTGKGPSPGLEDEWR